jgi:hypothetical protein
MKERTITTLQDWQPEGIHIGYKFLSAVGEMSGRTKPAIAALLLLHTVIANAAVPPPEVLCPTKIETAEFSDKEVTCAESPWFTSPVCSIYHAYYQSDFTCDDELMYHDSSYTYTFYGPYHEGTSTPVTALDQVGPELNIHLSYYAPIFGRDAFTCSIAVGDLECLSCSPCPLTASMMSLVVGDVAVPTSFRADCSNVFGGLNRSDTCIDVTPYPPIYDPWISADDEYDQTGDVPFSASHQDVIKCNKVDNYDELICTTSSTLIQGSHQVHFFTIWDAEVEGQMYFDVPEQSERGEAVVFDMSQNPIDGSYRCDVHIGTTACASCQLCEGYFVDEDVNSLGYTADCSNIVFGLDGSRACYTPGQYPPVYFPVDEMLDDPPSDDDDGRTTTFATLVRRFFGERLGRFFANFWLSPFSSDGEQD